MTNCHTIRSPGRQSRNTCLLLNCRPRRDGRLSWPGWLNHNGHRTHELVTCQAYIRRRSGKVDRLKIDVLTTEPLANWIKTEWKKIRRQKNCPSSRAFAIARDVVECWPRKEGREMGGAQDRAASGAWFSKTEHPTRISAHPSRLRP